MKDGKLTEKQKNKIAMALIVAGVGCMAVGVIRGEVQTVFLKAVQICMECIGIG